MEFSYTVTGGARIGWVNATWPFARLSVSADRLLLSMGLIGSYSFAPEQVVTLKPYGFIPILGKGIQIVHTNPDYPTKMVFWCFGSPERLIERIRQEGFQHRASSTQVQRRDGMPARWRAMRPLTPEENADVRREVWWTWVAITFFIVLAWMALPKAYSSGSSGLFLFATAIFAVVLITLIRHVWQLRADLSDGRAHIMTGTVDAVWRSKRRYVWSYHIRVGNEVYRISEDMYDEVDEGDMVQVEFLPRSHLVFTLEVIDTGEGTEEAEEVED